MDNFDTPEASSQANESENSTFLTTAPTANPVFYRTYSRRINGDRESWDDVVRRTTQGLAKLGQFSQEEADLIEKMQRQLKALPSGRWLWVGGTEWLDKPENVSGAYNCTNLNVIDWRSFGLMMDLAMMGCGTGAILEPKYIQQLPPIRNRLIVSVVGKIGDTPVKDRQEETTMRVDGNQVYIRVGDSRQGWSSSYEKLLSLSTNQWFKFDGEAHVTVDVSDVRPEGESLKGFGGVANPVRLTGLYDRCAAILNRAIGRQLTSVECCLLIDEAAATVVAGNIRRCLPEDAIVHTSRGHIPMKDVQVGDLVRTPLGFRRVTDKFDQGIQDVYTINTYETPLRSTLNHRHAVLDDDKLQIVWKQTSDLVPGDRLVHSTSYASLNLQSLPHLGGEGSNDPIPQKESGSENTGTGKVRIYKLYRLETENNDCYLSVSAVTVDGLGGSESVQTYDIEVEEAHCFYCDDYLTHNSAGMRQGISSDEQFAVAKDNLWQQDESGNWRIDPERDALRMANHTRVFHHQPTEQECIEAVRKQFYSGEGAIQYAPEAIARSSRDILPTEEIKAEFLAAICRGQGEEWLRERHPTMPEEEVQHRMARYGLNPCFAAGTMVMTRSGYFPIESLVGNPVEVWDGNQWVKIDGFRVTGTDQPVYKVELHDGSCVAVTAYHQFILEDGSRVEARQLQAGDRLMPNNQIVHGGVKANGAYLKGFLIGDGTSNKGMTILHLYETKWKCKPALIESASEIDRTVEVGSVRRNGQEMPDLSFGTVSEMLTTRRQSMRGLSGLDQDLILWVTAYREQFPSDVFNWDLDSKLKFIAGIMDADGTITDSKSNGFSYQLTSIHKEWLQGFQMLLKTLGVRSHVSLSKTAGVKDFGDRGGKCLTQSLYRITIAQAGAKWLGENCSFVRLNRFLDKTVSRQFKPKWNIVKSVEYSHVAPFVYCCNVPTNHKFAILSINVLSGNCGEIISTDFHCVAGDTMLIMRDGMRPIKELVGQSVEVWNGQRWSEVVPVLTGQNRQLYRVSFSDGTYLDVTEQHRFFVKDRFGKAYEEVTTGELGDRLKINGDGLQTEPFQIDYQDGKSIEPSLAYVLGLLVRDAEPFNEVARWNRESLLSFIAGLADAYGSKMLAGGGMYIPLSDYKWAYSLYLLLLKCGIYSSITYFGKNSGKDWWYLKISDCTSIPVSYKELDINQSGFEDMSHEDGIQIVESVELLEGLHDTFCFNEPEFHKGVFGGTLTGQCNLSEIHLNQIDPLEYGTQYAAFTAGALSVAALLNHKFTEPRYQYSRDLDPIVGVSFTGLFDFFVNAFGVDWLRWWEAGRPDTEVGQAFKQQEQEYLTSWRNIVHHVVWDYCDRHNLKRPNRCTTVQPAGTKSLLTGSSPGWHPPKAQRYIRRITFRRDDPVALACLDYGYSIVPSQTDKDEHGHLLQDPFDPRCTEWLVEIPVEIPWANLPGADEIAIEKFSAEAQFDFYMMVQRHYTTHNCFARDTQFLTSEGVKTFEDFNEGDSVIVLNADGDWVPANVVSTPDDRAMYAINLREALTGRVKTIVSTGCHRWDVQRPCYEDSELTILTTDKLKAGYRMVSNTNDCRWKVVSVDLLPEKQKGWCVMEPITNHFTLADNILTFNTSSTIELREPEIESLGRRIHQAIQRNEGYISSALLARFDDLQTFPRLPFEPISKDQYDQLCSEVLARRKTDNFHESMLRHDAGELIEAGPAGCDSDKCLLPEKKG